MWLAPEEMGWGVKECMNFPGGSLKSDLFSSGASTCPVEQRKKDKDSLFILNSLCCIPFWWIAVGAWLHLKLRSCFLVVVCVSPTFQDRDPS